MEHATALLGVSSSTTIIQDPLSRSLVTMSIPRAIDSGSQEVQRMAHVLDNQYPKHFDLTALKADPKHPDWQSITEVFRMMRSKENEQFNEKAIIEQWTDAVEGAVSAIMRRVIQLKYGNEPIESKERGLIKVAINRRKKMLFGEKTKDVARLKSHYGWCVQCERDIKTSGLPKWLL